MGQTLIGRPVSQRTSFATLNTASSPFSGLAATAPPIQQGPTVPLNTTTPGAINSNMISAGQFSVPSTIGGFRNAPILRGFQRQMGNL